MNREHLQAILWLRWRLTRNQWARSGGLSAVLAVFVGVGACVLGGLAFVGALLGGSLGLREAKPPVVTAIWFGVTAAFLFFWLIGLIADLQRSESIDLQRLLHLPVALGPFFVINYLVSHLSLSIILMVPAMTGLAIGLVVARGPLLLLQLPLAWSMVFMITAWTYCLRGWLATLMANPRRKRAIIMAITAGFIIVAQLPNLYFNVVRREPHSAGQGTNSVELQREREARRAAEKAQFDKLLATQKFIPPLWVSAGAGALVEGRAFPALFGMFGCAAIGALGLRRAYRTTIRFYTGGEKARKVAPLQQPPSREESPKRVAGDAGLVERRLPVVPEQAAALALASFRSMLRAPEVKLAWATSFIVTAILAATVLLRSPPKVPDPAKPFLATGAAAFSIFMMVQFLANQFGYDRQGFRALVLSPVERRLILLGKNLASLPVGLVFGVVLVCLMCFFLHVTLLTTMATLFQLGAMLLIGAMGGNVLSILVPYRIQAGSLKPSKMPALAMLVMLFSQLLFPLAMLPVFIAPLAELLWRSVGWTPLVPVNFLFSVALLGIMAVVYWLTLEPLGRLLRRRETRILEIVTAAVE